MTSAELVEWATARGVQLSRGPSGLRVKAPKGVLTEELREVLATKKPEILAWLDNNPGAPPNRRENAETADGQARPFDPVRGDRVNKVIWESMARLSAAFPNGADGFHERLRVTNPRGSAQVDQEWSRVGNEAGKFLRGDSVDETALIAATLAHERVCLDVFAVFAEFSETERRDEPAPHEQEGPAGSASNSAPAPDDQPRPPEGTAPACRNCQATDATVFLVMDDDSRLCGSCWKGVR